ncbi:YegP family protein [Rhodococcus sp. SJ-2]
MTTPRKHTLTLYRDRAGQWRWNRKASNGQIISDSAEAYVDRRDAIHGMHIANPDFRELRLVDDADNLALTTNDIDDEETERP